ncbi:hypothetical protein AMAG_00447 [Allomyces macrogynus ATCC 38327]|uniref:Uncharacterized protein n=1 Tax=Allomyces macrogynus (strain ATCC 38327) TaxID=578462 RepID=A0A0L0RWJ8_ALLM3|nr:hypothetical protein AMAG_00447 [Allomyces macrogynus ATCC 38327]|eukprot:KNE54475.1 hypothetical protein AMAG_00447 [Allomyces macrogynus ATCC 38327]
MCFGTVLVSVWACPGLVSKTPRTMRAVELEPFSSRGPSRFDIPSFALPRPHRARYLAQLNQQPWPTRSLTSSPRPAVPSNRSRSSCATSRTMRLNSRSRARPSSRKSPRPMQTRRASTSTRCGSTWTAIASISRASRPSRTYVVRFSAT